MEVEQKFFWAAKNSRHLRTTLPTFKSRGKIVHHIFRDTYYDSFNRLSENGLWVRKRDHGPDMRNGDPGVQFEWEAKRMRSGSSQLRSTFEETKDAVKISEMIQSIVAGPVGPVNNFGLDEMCHFETQRYSFLADDKFTIVLDTTNFGHQVGEVELLAEDTDKAHRDIDAFMEKYRPFFVIGNKPKGKLTAYFEKFGRHKGR